MTTFVVGASGATGKLLVEQLLASGQKVKIVIRASSHIPENWLTHENLSIFKGNITEFTVNNLAHHLADCQAVACCLGHNLTWKGIFGKPRKLVVDAIKLLCEASIENAPQSPTKFVLMNTAGNSNRDLKEPISFGQKLIMALIRLLLPPHSDNEKAADYLRLKIGQNHPYIEWLVVRPDTLLNEDSVSEYNLHQSPTSSAIFNPGKTSRINVAHS